MTGYIAEMRKLVGHRTLIQCAASVICIDDQGRLLLGKRSDNKMWGYSGGAVEIDERVEDCAKRELYEEMGVTDEVSNFEIVYLCRKWHGEPKSLDGEMEELRFFSCDEINLSEISPPIRHAVAAYIDKEKPKSI